MRKTKKNKEQMELGFQSKELVQTVKSSKATQVNNKSNKPAKSVKSSKATQVDKKSSKPAKSVKAKRSNTDLSKKSTKSKIKRKACGRTRSPGMLFDNLITVEELAVIFGLAPQTIRNWVAQGKLPRVKLGKRNWFLTGSLQEWLNKKEKPQWQ